MTKKLVTIAFAAALFAVCAWAAVPSVPPFTLQTLGIILAAGLLTPAHTLAAVGLYLAMGAVGLPVFAQFSGGPAVFAGPTGGFLLGFLPLGFCVSYAAKRFPNARRALGFGAVIGLALLYVLGALWFYWVAGQPSFAAALAVSVQPFLVPDLVKAIIAIALIRRLRPMFRDYRL